METNLRPLSLGEILDRTAQLYRSNFLLFAGIFAVYAGVLLFFNLLQLATVEVLRVEQLTRKLAWVPIVTAGIELLVVFLLIGAALAAISRAVAWANLGQPATIRGAYRSIMPKLGRFLWLMTITGVIAWLPLVILYGTLIGAAAYIGRTHTAAVHAAGAAPNPQSLAALGIVFLVFLLLLIPVGFYTIWMNLRYSLAVPACVVEDIKARAAIRRSVELTKGSRGRIFLLLLLVLAVKLGLVLFSQLFFVIAAFKHHGQMSMALNAASNLVAFFTNSFIGPIGAAGITLFYYDQRIRKEGYDIEWMMQAAGLAAPAASETIGGVLSSGDASETGLKPASTEALSAGDTGAEPL